MCVRVHEKLNLRVVGNRYGRVATSAIGLSNSSSSCAVCAACLIAPVSSTMAPVSSRQRGEASGASAARPAAPPYIGVPAGPCAAIIGPSDAASLTAAKNSADRTPRLASTSRVRPRWRPAGTPSRSRLAPLTDHAARGTRVGPGPGPGSARCCTRAQCGPLRYPCPVAAGAPVSSSSAFSSSAARVEATLPSDSTSMPCRRFRSVCSCLTVVRSSRF